MSSQSPWASEQAQKDQRQAERSSRIKARDMIESEDKRSMAKAVAIVIAVVLSTFALFLGILWAIVAVVRSAWGS